jgi:photosystem II stability/assembly factor-like uncharacterized protein
MGNGVQILLISTACLTRRVLLLFFLSLTIAAVAQSAPPELFNALKWRLIGPFRGGRVVAVSGVPGDGKTFYFGAVNGGVWKTTDAGTVWVPMFDRQVVASIGALAVAPSDPNIIYAGTGETDIRTDLSSGTGVYKSTDAGRTWKYIGLDETRQISRIVVDPRNADIVYVGALGHAYAPNEERGVYKSTDGGAHWTKVLDQGEEIGVSDLAICAGNPDILFAGTWHTWRPPWSTYATVDGPGSGLFRSPDGGKTWSQLKGNGLPDGDWGRVGVAVSADGRRVYAVIQAKKAGLYRSDDGGDTWVLANADPRLTSRAWYFNRVTIDPNSPDVVYIPNVALYRSEDGGKTISVVRGAPGGDDYHELWIDPGDSSRMVLGTDQGTTVSLDRGQTWTTWYNQPTAQMYHVITDNQFPYVVYGTQQDSGSAAVFSRTDYGQITPRDWFPAGPSESGYIALDRDEPNIVYVTGPYGSVARYNRRTGLSQDIDPWPLFLFDREMNDRKYRAPWTPVLVSSPTEPKTLLLGTQFVMKTRDGGLHWETISPDLTGALAEAGKKSDDPPTIRNAKERGFGVVLTLAPSPLNRDLIWAGSDTGLIHITRDGGKTWKNVTPAGLSAWSKVSLIEASHFDPAVAYAAVDRSALDDRTPFIYRTRDYGATWQLIANGLAAPAFVRAVREDPAAKGLLFAATEFGVYVSFDDGDRWQSLQLNLPVTGVRDLTIHDDDLIAATFGRSFWILDDMSPLRQTAEAAKASAVFLYRPARAVRVDNDTFVGTPLPPEEPTAENPPNGAIIDYVLKNGASSVKLEIFDDKHNLVRRFSSEDRAGKHIPLPVAERWFPKPELLQKTPGMHRFVWSLNWGSSGGPSADEDSDTRNPAGPKVIPRTYQVKLEVDGKESVQPLQVIMDPRSPATPEVLAQQLQLGKQIFEDTLLARRALAEISSVQKQLTDLQAKLTDPKQPLVDALAQGQVTLNRILKQEADTTPQGPGLQDAYLGLASALRVVESGDRKAPSQAIALYEESKRNVYSGIEQWNAFKQTRLPALNQALRDANLPPVAIGEIEREVEMLMTR